MSQFWQFPTLILSESLSHSLTSQTSIIEGLGFLLITFKRFYKCLRSFTGAIDKAL